MPNASRLEWIGKYAAILSALVAATVGIGQYRRGVSQSIRELEWKQADMARTLINGMMEDEGWQAMTMLDWEEGRDLRDRARHESAYPPTRCSRGDRSGLTSERVASARRHSDSSRTDMTGFCSEVSQLQAAVRSGLVRKDDVRFPLEWYVEKRLCQTQEAASCVHGRELHD